MASYPLYDTLKLSNDKAENALTLAFAKVISQIDDLKTEQRNNELFSGHMKTQINKLMESSRFDGNESSYIQSQSEQIKSLIDKFTGYKGSEDETKLLAEADALHQAKKHIEKALNDRKIIVKTDSLEIKVYFHEGTIPYEKFDEMLTQSHDKYIDNQHEIEIYEMGEKGYKSASFGFLYDPQNTKTIDAILNEFVKLVQEEHIRIQESIENPLYRADKNDVPLMILNGNTNVISELLKGFKFSDTIGKRSESQLMYTGTPQRMHPHFEIQGTTEFSAPLSDFYQRSWLGFDDYEKHAIVSAKAFIDENKELEHLADKVIKKAKSPEKNLSSEHSM